jgi:hypothetical protein
MKKMFSDSDRKRAYGRGHADGYKKGLSQCHASQDNLEKAYYDGYYKGREDACEEAKDIHYRSFTYTLNYTLTAMLESRQTQGCFLLRRFLMALQGMISTFDHEENRYISNVPCDEAEQKLSWFTRPYHWEKEEKDRAKDNENEVIF